LSRALEAIRAVLGDGRGEWRVEDRHLAKIADPRH
jgi:hypothetical protein